MKVIIAGSRSFFEFYEETPSIIINECVEDSQYEIGVVISGTAVGPDTYGEIWAKKHNLPVMRFFPDWKLNGKAGGIIRNMEMGDIADAAIVLWDGNSNGSKHMIKFMEKLGKPVQVFTWDRINNSRYLKGMLFTE